MLSLTYNKAEPVIFNTYQAYLKGSYERILEDMERARREKYIFAAKLVRLGLHMSMHHCTGVITLLKGKQHVTCPLFALQVRGAYVSLERARAAKLGYESPIWDNIQQTHSNYNTCLEAVLDEVGLHLPSFTLQCVAVCLV